MRDTAAPSSRCARSSSDRGPTIRGSCRVHAAIVYLLMLRMDDVDPLHRHMIRPFRGLRSQVIIRLRVSGVRKDESEGARVFAWSLLRCSKISRSRADSRSR